MLAYVGYVVIKPKSMLRGAIDPRIICAHACIAADINFIKIRDGGIKERIKVNVRVNASVGVKEEGACYITPLNTIEN